ncbi:AbgT family transporter [Anaeromicrobium sediminis]|uniref:Aminobenzoyl-glutamate transporter n=1 Tax=Anaeromicrobium sediminis TaxID=1478221 RepID=A0A267MKJ8_9FIRM|nr:AbgT family transporter [Anaeromicrobium sediminis]PAB59947.1 aminobenzoyl-glutamate transporter [Anaeromicrobium sediminis]
MKTTEKKNGLFFKFLDTIEKVGNRLPHPVTIFLLFSLAVMVISHIAAKAGVQIDFTMIDRKTNEVKDVTIQAVTLLDADGIRYMFSKAVKNFTGFAPLGTVLVAMLGVGVAEGTGLISALLRKLVLSTPKKLITMVVVFAGIMSNVASDAGYVVLVPLGAIVFLSFGRHPLAGLAAAFAGVSGGFSANLLVGTVDPLLGGISTEAARFISEGYTVAPTANWYFMIVSTFIITAIGTLVTEKIVEPRLGEYKGEEAVDLDELTADEKRGLRMAGIALLIFVGTIVALVVPEGAILRNPETGGIMKGSAFMAGLVPIITLFFLIPGVAYGIAAKTVKSDKDVVRFMSKAMSTMGGYLVLAFVAAQFVAYFKYTNLGTILAVKGADFLQATGMTGLPMIIGFIIVSAFINLFIGSASAKWAIMAPVFIPMLMRIGYSPEFTQVAYRIGDSTTNIISPLMSYFAVIVAFAQKYDKKIGIGTLISTMVPYSMMFLLGWSILLIIWFITGAPIGPDAFIKLPM